MLTPMDTTTDPSAALFRQITDLRERTAHLEVSRRGIGTVVAATYEAAKAALPKPGNDGQMILAKGFGKPVLFVYDDEGESKGTWYAIKAEVA
jgi:hypothetical protein